VLVAFVILTLVVLALFRLFSGALGNASAADEYGRALAIAESRIAAAGVEKPLREARESGREDDGRFEWVVATAPLAQPQEDTAQPAVTGAQALQQRLAGRTDAAAAFQLWSVTATVTWPGAGAGNRSVELSTVRIAPRE
jgi:general secretion pathway protein I